MRKAAPPPNPSASPSSVANVVQPTRPGRKYSEAATAATLPDTVALEKRYEYLAVSVILAERKTLIVVKLLPMHNYEVSL